MTIEKSQKSNKHNIINIAGILIFFAFSLYFGFTEGFVAAQAYFN